MIFFSSQFFQLFIFSVICKTTDDEECECGAKRVDYGQLCKKNDEDKLTCYYYGIIPKGMCN